MASKYNGQLIKFPGIKSAVDMKEFYQSLPIRHEFTDKKYFRSIGQKVKDKKTK